MTWFVSFECRKADTQGSFLAQWDACDAPDAEAAEAEYRRRKTAQGYEVGKKLSIKVLRSLRSKK